MIDSDFTEIFGELLGEHDAEEELLAAVAALVPGSGLLLLTEDGTRLRAGIPLELSADQETALRADLSQVAATAPRSAPVLSSPAAQRTQTGWVYALTVQRFAGVLFWLIPGTVNLVAEPAGAFLLHNTLLYALGEQDRQEMAAQEGQFRSQIEVLKRQHGRLIEDNYRQYSINREKEQEYARTLESEIARQTAELRKANARLEESSRLKSEFLANMSHELRTPMNAITGFAQLLADTSLDTTQQEYCRTIRQSSATLLALINDILDLAKIEAGRLELEIVAFDLDELLESVAAMFSLSIREKGIAIQVRRDQGLPRAYLGDSHRLRQVLTNLVGNAVKFTESGGVELLVESVAPPEAARQEQWLRFVVRDSGIGIPPHRLEAIFEKFTQADGSTTRRFGGTGLGLAICRQLVELMGGRIEVESLEGQGSCFSFTIGLSAVEAADLAAAPAPAAPAPGRWPEAGGRRVLLVEDNPVNQRLASLMISKQGCEVAVAADGLEALARLREEKFDLVLMDVQMPRLDGLAATREIRLIEKDLERRGEYASLAGGRGPIRIVGLTAHARSEDEQACYAAGMDDFLSKPIVREKLLEVLSGPVA
ncbi:ATP-binding protein [Desulfurivibrio alkaliphilus]|uniref:histidine kinase n=1 Tax=Desulfurivibrio alkaliphilus (strain DSM 19089 / UNIQEM U267 / AHT2) TaxID=589865 RepID=D6Z3B3_DESAT|nr:ATP-binding protein [Desulfurivibrio alkaliphilus]ADH86038.1 histidine kinase [Desulfurivibrio alkaliphilus AHT 2]